MPVKHNQCIYERNKCCPYKSLQNITTDKQKQDLSLFIKSKFLTASGVNSNTSRHDAMYSAKTDPAFSSALALQNKKHWKKNDTNGWNRQKRSNYAFKNKCNRCSPH